ncbi:hypothetical protein [Dactylosporangium sp. NPDC049140]|jgi:RNA polymerase sigma factor for flagellar operon FliA|uniref:hypothetical protein n=1 Tax=Dactylosporangium sp. NPDC049140 TaxID=3155647 RepID=UPI0034107852
MLLRDGLNTHLDPDLVSASDKPAGCVARRREAYHDEIASAGNLNSRPARTNHHGMPFSQSGRHA